MIKISAVIIARNEALHIEACLQSVKWVDEIILVDDQSTDTTVSLARKYTDKIYEHKSVGYVEPVRKFALEKATGDWIFLLDADERVSSDLAEYCRKVSKDSSPYVAYAIPRKNIIFNKWIRYTGWWPDHQLRFFQKNKVTWPDTIHSKPIVTGDIYQLAAEENIALEHINYETTSQMIQKIERYATIMARERSDRKELVSWNEFISKPAEEFFSRFFAREGYRDGIHGLVLSCFMAFQEFFTLTKMWETRKFAEPKNEVVLDLSEKEFEKIKKQCTYWIYNEKLKTTKGSIDKIYFRLKRKYHG